MFNTGNYMQEMKELIDWSKLIYSSIFVTVLLHF